MFLLYSISSKSPHLVREAISRVSRNAQNLVAIETETMYLQSVGFVAAYFIISAAAAHIAYTAPARKTEHAELTRKSASAIAPVPTSPSQEGLVELELLKRVYVMPPDTCGFYRDNFYNGHHREYC